MSFATFTALPMNFSQVLLSSVALTSQQDSKRSQLTADIVLAIFELRPARSELDGTFVPCARLVRKISSQFQVKERTVRDIWNRRSWSNVTRPRWTPSEIVAEFGASAGDAKLMDVLPAQSRKRGRPMGSKDTVKRCPKPAAARGSPACDTVSEIEIGALTESDIYNLIADDTSDDDTAVIDTAEHSEADESFTCDELESLVGSCDEDFEEAMTSEGAMSGICFESNPWSW